MDLKSLLDQAKKDIETMQQSDIDLPPEAKGQLLAMMLFAKEEGDDDGEER